MKKLLLVSALAAVFGTAHAGTVTFATPSETISNIAAFDWSPANVLAVNGNAAFVNFVNSGGACPANSCNFTVYAQGTLSAYKDPSNVTIASGIGSTYEITYQMAFEETVIGAAAFPGSNIASFNFVSGGTNFFNLYYDNNVGTKADDLAGTGFGEGIHILTGNVAPSGAYTSSFNASTSSSSIVPIGGASSTTPVAWGTEKTVSGSGGTSSLDLLAIAPTILDPSFFPSQTLTSWLLSSLGQTLAFTTVNPSLSFPIAGYVGAGSVPAAIGAINGGTTGSAPSLACPTCTLVATAPDILFQTDPNSPVSANHIPEPATLGLLGLGLLGLGLARRRNKA